MSLMRLLTTGKTLVDLKNSTSRYHMPGKSILPKFGSMKNPFVTAAKNQPAQVAAEITPKNEPRESKNELVQMKETKRLPMLPEKMKETKRLPFVAARNGVEKQDIKPTVWKKILGGAGAVIGKLNQLAWRLDPNPPVKSGIPRFDKPVVQGELSLDNIKVVRNDLSDADMEIVPAKTFTGQTNFKPALQSQVKSGMAVSQGSAA
jgi:hypothetical protein